MSSKTFSRPWIAATLLLSCLPTSSCSILEPGEGEEIRVINRTGGDLLFKAWELHASFAVDPAPSFHLDPVWDRVLHPGESRTLLPEDVNGDYARGKDLGIFLFEVQGDSAVYRTLYQVTAHEIRARNGRLRITGF